MRKSRSPGFVEVWNSDVSDETDETDETDAADRPPADLPPTALLWWLRQCEDEL